MVLSDSLGGMGFVPQPSLHYYRITELPLNQSQKLVEVFGSLNQIDQEMVSDAIKG